MQRRNRFALLLALATLMAGLMVSQVAAQGARKPKPLATPVPTLTGAEIISRADDMTEPSVPVSAPPTTTSQSTDSARVKALTARIAKLESASKNDYDEKQKRMLLNLDILTRAEQRSESMRKQLFEMIEKESAVKSRLDQIDYESRPEMIERSLQLTGSMKPEEVRDARRKSLLAEKANLQALLTEIQNTRANIALNLQKSDLMVEKLRGKLEKDIDDSFLKDDPER
jgi:hypothetical protein